MLVFTRKIDERIQIGDEIIVTVVRVSEGVVRLGVEAPAGTPIMRGELLRALESADDPMVAPRWPVD